MEDKVDRKFLAKIVREKLKEGKSKQEVYDELVSEFKYSNDLADVVRYIPSLSRWKKYGIWNTLYLLFIIAITPVTLFPPTSTIVWMVALIYIIATKRFKVYYYNALLGVIIFVSMIIYSVYKSEFSWLLALILIVSLVLIIAGFYLPKVLTPPFTEVREPYINSEGESRIMVKHIFSD